MKWRTAHPCELEEQGSEKTSKTARRLGFRSFVSAWLMTSLTLHSVYNAGRQQCHRSPPRPTPSFAAVSLPHPSRTSCLFPRHRLCHASDHHPRPSSSPLASMAQPRAHHTYLSSPAVAFAQEHGMSDRGFTTGLSYCCPVILACLRHVE